MNASKKDSKKEYYLAGMKMLLSSGETLDNYKNILHEYEDALVVRQKRIDDLYNEIKVVKKLKIRS